MGKITQTEPEKVASREPESKSASEPKAGSETESKPTKSDIQITSTLLRKKLRGRATYNAATRVLTITYDFHNKIQLKDFEGEPRYLPGGALGVEAAQTVKHIVKFKTVTVTGMIAYRNAKGSVLTSSEGLLVVREGNWLTVGYKEAKNRDSHTGLGNDSRTLPFELNLTAKTVTVSMGNAVLGQEIRDYTGAGQIKFCGMDGGAIFSKITMSGEVDPEWAKGFFAE